MTEPEERTLPEMDDEEQEAELEQALDDAAIGDTPNAFDDPQAAERKERGGEPDTDEDSQAPTPPG